MQQQPLHKAVSWSEEDRQLLTQDASVTPQHVEYLLDSAYGGMSPFG